MCVYSCGTAHVRYGVTALHQRLLTTHVVLEDAVHYLSYNCRRWNMRIPCNCFIVVIFWLYVVYSRVDIEQWFPTSGPRTTSGPQKLKYGPRTILILWLGMVRRSFYLIITVNFYYTYMHSGPCYQEWYKSGPWLRKGWEPLL